MDTSLSELLRDYVKELLVAKTDLSTTEKRSQAVTIFLEKYSDRKFKRASARTSFERILLTEGKKEGKSSEDFGKQTKAKQTPKFRMTPDMESEISGSNQSLEHLKKVPSGQPVLKEGETKTEVSSIVFEPEDVSAAIAAFWLMIKIMYPELELLTDQEKASLGRLWLPAFQKYLSENWKVIIIPLLSTMGIMFPKIKKARDKKKDKKVNKELQKTRDEEKPKQLTCPYCNKLFDRKLIEDHKEKCPARK